MSNTYIHTHTYAAASLYFRRFTGTRVKGKVHPLYRH